MKGYNVLHRTQLSFKELDEFLRNNPEGNVFNHPKQHINSYGMKEPEEVTPDVVLLN